MDKKQQICVANTLDEMELLDKLYDPNIDTSNLDEKHYADQHLLLRPCKYISNQWAREFHKLLACQHRAE